jgi:hypothetical protein
VEVQMTIARHRITAISTIPAQLRDSTHLKSCAERVNR